MLGQEAGKDLLYLSPCLSNVQFWLDQFSNGTCSVADSVVLAQGGNGEDTAEEDRTSDAVQIGQILKAHATIIKKTHAKTIKTITCL